MTDDSSLSDEIREFIQSYIPSAGSLEILLLLFHNSGETWTMDTIATKLRSNRTMVKDFLLYFESKGLVARDENSYRLNDQQPDLISTMKELTDCFHERRVSVLNEIYRIPNKPGSKIQLFADAFKIKKEK